MLPSSTVSPTPSRRTPVGRGEVKTEVCARAAAHRGATRRGARRQKRSKRMACSPLPRCKFTLDFIAYVNVRSSGFLLAGAGRNSLRRRLFCKVSAFQNQSNCLGGSIGLISTARGDVFVETVVLAS